MKTDPAEVHLCHISRRVQLFIFQSNPRVYNRSPALGCFYIQVVVYMSMLGLLL